MSLKKKIEGKLGKLQTRVFGKRKEIMITTGKGGLTKAEIKDVLATISRARRQGTIPAMSYEYHPPSFIDRREPIWLKPKTSPLATARVKLRAVIRSKYGSIFRAILRPYHCP